MGSYRNLKPSRVDGRSDTVGADDLLHFLEARIVDDVVEIWDLVLFWRSCEKNIFKSLKKKFWNFCFFFLNNSLCQHPKHPFLIRAVWHVGPIITTISKSKTLICESSPEALHLRTISQKTSEIEYMSAFFRDSKLDLLMVPFKTSGAMYLTVPCLVFRLSPRYPVSLGTKNITSCIKHHRFPLYELKYWRKLKSLTYLTASPRSQMQHVRSFLTSMFLLFKSRWATHGLAGKRKEM